MSWNPAQGLRKTGGSRLGPPKKIFQDGGKVVTPPTPELSGWRTSPRLSDGIMRQGDVRILRIVTPTSDFVELVRRDGRQEVEAASYSISTQTEGAEQNTLVEQQEHRPVPETSETFSEPDDLGLKGPSGARDNPTVAWADADVSRAGSVTREIVEERQRVDLPRDTQAEQIENTVAEHISTGRSWERPENLTVQEVEQGPENFTSHRKLDAGTSRSRRRKHARIEKKERKEGESSPRELQVVPFSYPSLVGQYDPSSDSVVIGLDIGSQVSFVWAETFGQIKVLSSKGGFVTLLSEVGSTSEDAFQSPSMVIPLAVWLGVLDLRERFMRAFEREMNFFSDSRGYCYRLKTRQSQSARKERQQEEPQKRVTTMPVMEVNTLRSTASSRMEDKPRQRGRSGSESKVNTVETREVGTQWSEQGSVTNEKMSMLSMGFSKKTVNDLHRLIEESRAQVEAEEAKRRSETPRQDSARSVKTPRSESNVIAKCITVVTPPVHIPPLKLKNEEDLMSNNSFSQPHSNRYRHRHGYRRLDDATSKLYHDEKSSISQGENSRLSPWDEGGDESLLGSEWDSRILRPESARHARITKEISFPRAPTTARESRTRNENLDWKISDLDKQWKTISDDFAISKMPSYLDINPKHTTKVCQVSVFDMQEQLPPSRRAHSTSASGPLSARPPTQRRGKNEGAGAGAGAGAPKSARVVRMESAQMKQRHVLDSNSFRVQKRGSNVWFSVPMLRS